MNLSAVECRSPARRTTDHFTVMIPGMFHAATFGYNVLIVLYWLKLNIPSNMNANMPSLRDNWWQYLTVWNLVFQGSYFTICAIDDFLRINTPRKVLVDVKERLEWARDTLFQSLTLPLCMCVAGIFWVTFAYDRELVFPKAMDAIIPFWYNHLLHTAVVIFPWVDMLICQRPYAQCKSRYLLGMAVMAIYNAVVIAAAHWQGYWTYPLLSVMTPVQKTLFFAFMYSSYTAAYIIGVMANEKICGKI